MFEGFAKLRQSITAVVFLRRISRELHRANELDEIRLALEFPAWYRSSYSAKSKNKTLTNILTRSTKLSDLSTPSVESWNDNYSEKHPKEPDAEDEYDIT